MDFRWYTLQVGPGTEDKVVESIVEGVSRKGLDDCLDEVLVPTEEVVEVRNGVKARSKKKLYPGYVFLRGVVTDEIRQVVSNIPQPAKFLGSGDRAAPISEAEAERVVNQAREGVERPRSSVVFEIGEEVVVSDERFEGFKGKVEEVDSERSRLKVSISIFGRDTLVDLEFFQVNKSGS